MIKYQNQSVAPNSWPPPRRVNTSILLYRWYYTWYSLSVSVCNLCSTHVSGPNPSNFGVLRIVGISFPFLSFPFLFSLFSLFPFLSSFFLPSISSLVSSVILSIGGCLLTGRLVPLRLPLPPSPAGLPPTTSRGCGKLAMILIITASISIE